MDKSNILLSLLHFKSLNPFLLRRNFEGTKWISIGFKCGTKSFFITNFSSKEYLRFESTFSSIFIFFEKKPILFCKFLVKKSIEECSFLYFKEFSKVSESSTGGVGIWCTFWFWGLSCSFFFCSISIYLNILFIRLNKK